MAASPAELVVALADVCAELGAAVALDRQAMADPALQRRAEHAVGAAVRLLVQRQAEDAAAAVRLPAAPVGDGQHGRPPADSDVIDTEVRPVLARDLLISVDLVCRALEEPSAR